MMVVKNDVQIYDSLFVLMAKSDDDENEKATILDIKNNLKDYSPKELRSLAIMLIDYECDLTKYKESLSKNIDELEVENMELIEQMPKLQEYCQSLSFENDLLNENLSEKPKFN